MGFVDDYGACRRAKSIQVDLPIKEVRGPKSPTPYDIECPQEVKGQYLATEEW